MAAAMMFSEGMMTFVTVPFSKYLYDHRDEYLNALFNVSAKDDFDTWFAMFLDAVTEESQRSMRLIDDVISLRNGMMGGESNQNRLKVIDALFDNPYVMVSDVMDITGLTRPGALKLISSLEQEGILKEVSGRQRGRVYLSNAIREAAYVR